MESAETEQQRQECTEIRIGIRKGGEDADAIRHPFVAAHSDRIGDDLPENGKEEVKEQAVLRVSASMETLRDGRISRCVPSVDAGRGSPV